MKKLLLLCVILFITGCTDPRVACAGGETLQQVFRRAKIYNRLLAADHISEDEYKHFMEDLAALHKFACIKGTFVGEQYE